MLGLDSVFTVTSAERIDRHGQNEAKHTHDFGRKGTRRPTHLNGEVVQLVEHRGRLAVDTFLDQVPRIGHEEHDPVRRSVSTSEPNKNADGDNNGA